MADDPYSKWLGLPAGPRPPKAHELLGLPANPTDAAQIDEAAGRCMDKLDQYALSNDRATRSQIQQLMNEVAKARTKLVAKVPKPKPKAESKPKPVTPAPAGALPQPTKQATRPPATKPVPQANGASPAPVAQLATAPAVTLESLPYAGSSSFSDQTKSAVVFWFLITMAWAATLAAVFAVTYIIIAPQAPEPARDVVLAGVDPSGNPAAPGPETEQPDPASEAQAPEPEPEPEPVGPTAEELAAQEAEQARLAREKAQAEQARLAELERQRQETLRMQAAERLEQERLQAERLAQARREAEELAEWSKKTYYEKRDALEGAKKLDLIAKELSARNGGHPIKFDATVENGQIIGMDFAVSKDLKKIRPDNEGLVDLTPLSGLKLKRLDLSHLASLTTLEGLEDMPLEWLNLSDCQSLKTLDTLKGMPLEHLNIEYCQSLSDISAIKGMPLKWLAMSTLKIKDLEPLRGLPLTYLSCTTCLYITSTAPLKGMKLETVKLSACTSLNDLSGLDSLNAAEGEVSLFQTSITNLRQLRGQKIGKLILSRCRKLRTLDDLKGATFKQLYMRYMDNLEDITALRQIKVTDVLELGGPKVTNLSPLSNTLAKSVRIDCSQVNNLRGLENLPNIENLYIQTMKQISREEIERIKARYEDLRIVSQFRSIN